LLPKTFTISEKVGEPNNSKTFGAIKPKGFWVDTSAGGLLAPPGYHPPCSQTYM
jgi:hypothetical protein